MGKSAGRVSGPPPSTPTRGAGTGQGVAPVAAVAGAVLSAISQLESLRVMPPGERRTSRPECALLEDFGGKGDGGCASQYPGCPRAPSTPLPPVPDEVLGPRLPELSSSISVRCSFSKPGGSAPRSAETAVP